MLSGLESTFEEIREAVCRYLTGSRDMDQVTSQERKDIEEILRRGCRRFYYPATSGPTFNHEWSFLTVAFTFETVSEVHTYEMPPDFGGFEGWLTHAEGDSFGYIQIRKVPEEHIRLYHSGQTSAVGAPQFYCERPKGSSGMAAQGWEIDLWPSPDAAYSLTGMYRVHPNALSGIRKYPYGGPDHANTLYLACMAEAELFDKGMAGGYMNEFRTALNGSILIDRATHAAQNHGYNSGNGQVNRPRFQRVRGNANFSGV